MDTMTTGGTMTVAWMPMCGQSWIGAAASFLGMWTVMMAAMMLPSLLPRLWRYRRAISLAGERRAAILTAIAGGAYLLVWALLGVVVFPLGATVMAIIARHPDMTRAVPATVAALVLASGALQLSRWKARHLAHCRESCSLQVLERGHNFAASLLRAWLRGLRLGLHCAQCCAGLTTALLVTGMMDLPAMIAVTAAITLERLAPAGERVARAIGLMVLGGGLLLSLRAAGLG
ncbi:MAG TPA: DUF2182 domain-containing protein [Steroidobacteraceae bacterium]|nr:DUF2182 domain-containing protein [Steroidobacteraceae bacterium]